MARPRTALGARPGDHPTTCAVTYTPAQAEFLAAVDRYKRATGRRFPTLCELLTILETLGYRKEPRP